MTDHDNHSHTITSVGLSGSFHRGPLDGAGFLFWMPSDQDLTDLRVTLPREDGRRDLYLYDPQPDPASHEDAMRYIGTVPGPA